MTNPHLTFHHFGLAVRRPDEARRFVAALGYAPGESVFDPAQNVHLQLCTHAEHPAVEIVWPGDSTGPLERLARGHPAAITSHCSGKTDNLPAPAAGVEEGGLPPTCISPATPAPL